MNPIEDELKTALGRKPAPAGFSRRLLSRIESGSGLRPRPKRFFRQRRWILAAAAAILMAAFAGLIQHRQYIRTRNEAALQQTLSALLIATEQLDRAKARAFESLPDVRIEHQK